MRITDPKTRKSLLNLSKETPKALKEFLAIRGDVAGFKTKLDSDSCLNTNGIFKLMKKKNCALFLSYDGKNSISLGRSYNGQPLEVIKFKIRNMLSSSDFKTLPPELNVKYFCIFLNIKNKKIENLFVDLLNQPSSKINISAVKYAWVISQADTIITIKFVRVLDDISIEEIGPFFEIETEKEFFCSDELREQAFSVKIPKKQKNVSKNIFKDKIGKIYIEKQDLKDINTRKSRAYKNKQFLIHG